MAIVYPENKKVFRPTAGFAEADNMVFTMLADCPDYRCQYKVADTFNTYIGRPEARYDSAQSVASTLFVVLDDFDYLVVWLQTTYDGKVIEAVTPEIWAGAFEEPKHVVKRGRPKGSKNKPKEVDYESVPRPEPLADESELLHIAHHLSVPKHTFGCSHNMKTWHTHRWSRWDQPEEEDDNEYG